MGFNIESKIGRRVLLKEMLGVAGGVGWLTSGLQVGVAQESAGAKADKPHCATWWPRRSDVFGLQPESIEGMVTPQTLLGEGFRETRLDSGIGNWQAAEYDVVSWERMLTAGAVRPQTAVSMEVLLCESSQSARRYLGVRLTGLTGAVRSVDYGITYPDLDGAQEGISLDFSLDWGRIRQCRLPLTQKGAERRKFISLILGRSLDEEDQRWNGSLPEALDPVLTKKWIEKWLGAGAMFFLPLVETGAGVDADNILANNGFLPTTMNFEIGFDERAIRFQASRREENFRSGRAF